MRRTVLVVVPIILLRKVGQLRAKRAKILECGGSEIALWFNELDSERSSTESAMGSSSLPPQGAPCPASRLG